MSSFFKNIFVLALTSRDYKFYLSSVGVGQISLRMCMAIRNSKKNANLP